MDYVWTLSTGEMTLYPNNEVFKAISPASLWLASPGVIWTPPTDMDRRDLHLVDWDGDGDCDIVWVNPDANNQVSVWINNYPQTQNWATAWTSLGTPPEAAGLSCAEKRGIGILDGEFPTIYRDLFHSRH